MKCRYKKALQRRVIRVSETFGESRSSGDARPVFLSMRPPYSPHAMLYPHLLLENGNSPGLFGSFIELLFAVVSDLVQTLVPREVLQEYV